MVVNKKIGIVTTHSFGYIKFLIDELNKNPKVDLVYVNIDEVPFNYKNIFSRVGNVFLKLVFGYGMKDLNRTNCIVDTFGSTVKYDQILIIRPDKLQQKALHFLRDISVELTCFLFDGIENFSAQKNLVSIFDIVYSYDKNDVANCNFTFLPNYIYDDQIITETIKQKVFNISSYDERFTLMQKLAQKLSSSGISYRFIIKKNNISPIENFEIISKYLLISDVKKIIFESEVLVDIQKDNQTGLSFRVLEALGYGKKLITNNADIVTYDFYNKNNIYLLSNDNWDIPFRFFDTEYIPVPENIIEHYKLATWIEKVFKINNN